MTQLLLISSSLQWAIYNMSSMAKEKGIHGHAIGMKHLMLNANVLFDVMYDVFLFMQYLSLHDDSHSHHAH